MAAPNAGNIVVAGVGHVYVAPVLSTTLPVDIATALNAAWIELGFTTEDGVQRTDGRSMDEVNTWQSFYPSRRIVTAKTGGVSFTMREYNPDTVALAFGGGTVTKVTGPPAYAAYTPPAPEVIDFRQLLVVYQDGADIFRYVIPRGMVTNEVQSNLTRTSALDLPVTFDITPATSPTAVSNPPTAAQLATQPWYEATQKGIFTA
jgi:hypothetical protein